jgi:hypothetical protein
MAYSNIAQVTTSNTFNMWRLVTNNLSNAVNQIAGNTTYTKDDGSWVLSNGFISLSNTSGTTLTVSANATISKILTVADIVLTGNITGGLATVMYNQANTAYNQANTAYNQANTAYNTANNAANTVRVSANSIATLSGQQLNFVNTATVTVTVTSGISGNANIAFTSVGSGGSVTSVATGLGLTGGTITTTGTISAVAASTSVQGVVKLIDNVTTTDSSNAATATAVKTAYDAAITANNSANNSANTVQVYANSTLVLSKANLNFVNSATALVSVINNSGQANVSYSVNTAAITSLGTLSALDISGSAANIFDTPIVSVTSSSSFSDNAAGKVLLCDSTSPTSITLTFTAAAKANFAVTIIRNGTGNVIIANTSTIQKQNTTSYTTANISSQFAAATVLYTATNKFILLGDIT